MRIIHLSFFIFISFISQSQKFITFYERQDYLKSMDLCKKAIEKDKSNLDAFLYKALNYTQIAIAPETAAKSKYNFEQAVSNLILIRSRKNGKEFLELHKKETDFIMQSAYQSGLTFLENNELKIVTRLSEQLLKFDTLPEYYYLVGKIKIMNGDKYDGLQLINDAAFMIYSEYKNGKISQPYLQEAFLDLAQGIYEDGDILSALEILLRTMKLFHKPDADDAFISLLNKENNTGQFHDSEVAEQIYHYCDSVKIQRPERSEELSKVQLDLLKNRYVSDINSKNFSDIISMLNNYVCGNPISEQLFYQIILSDICASTKIVSNYGKESIEIDTLFRGIKNQSLLCNNMFDGSNIISSIQDSVNIGNLIGAARLYYFFNEKENGKDKLPKAFEIISSATKQQYVIDSNFISAYEVSIFLRDKNFTSSLADASMKTVEKLIAAKKFAQAGEIIRQNIKDYPKNTQWKYLLREWVKSDYYYSYLPTDNNENIYATEPDKNNCTSGVLNTETQKNFLQALIYFRRLAGIYEPCKLEKKFNDAAQDAAMMMDVNNDLSHFPQKDWLCYSTSGANAAGHSNLSWGYGGVSALVGQLEDSGGGNESAGHRRWILNPLNSVFGHGSSTNTMALYVFGTDGYSEKQFEKYKDKYFTWPVEGYFPSCFNTSRWSFSLYYASYEKAKVEVYQGKQRVPITVYEPSYGYGISTLVWEMSTLGNDFYQRETTYKVIIRDVTYGDEQELRSYTYEITFIPSYGISYE